MKNKAVSFTLACILVCSLFSGLLSGCGASTSSGSKNGENSISSSLDSGSVINSEDTPGDQAEDKTKNNTGEAPLGGNATEDTILYTPESYNNTNSKEIALDDSFNTIDSIGETEWEFGKTDGETDGENGAVGNEQSEFVNNNEQFSGAYFSEDTDETLKIYESYDAVTNFIIYGNIQRLQNLYLEGQLDTDEARLEFQSFSINMREKWGFDLFIETYYEPNSLIAVEWGKLSKELDTVYDNLNTISIKSLTIADFKYSELCGLAAGYANTIHEIIDYYSELNTQSSGDTESLSTSENDGLNDTDVIN